MSDLDSPRPLVAAVHLPHPGAVRVAIDADVCGVVAEPVATRPSMPQQRREGRGAAKGDGIRQKRSAR